MVTLSLLQTTSEKIIPSLLNLCTSSSKQYTIFKWVTFINELDCFSPFFWSILLKPPTFWS